jgi:membrane associated rhomboid family serine protease
VFIPFRDDNPARSFPFMTVVLIAANVAVFVYMTSLDAQGHDAYNHFVKLWAATPISFVRHPTDPGVWATAFTAMFLHQGVMHLAGNMLYLWIFGNNVEDLLGPFRYLLFYIVCGLLATGTYIAVTVLTDPRSASEPMLGASGAIAGVLGAYLVRFPRAKVETCLIFFFVTVVRLPAIIVLGGWFLLQLLNGVGALGGAANESVAYWAHIGGFIAGMVLVWPFAAWADLE